MKSLKHIGRMENSGSRVLVVFRTLPGESDQALVLPVSNLNPENHDALMNLIETPQAQDSFELGEIMFYRTFSDGRPMLAACQADGAMAKASTDTVIMTPNTSDELKLSELNVLIAEQKNVAVDDLYTFVKGAQKIDDVATVKELGEPSVPEYNDDAAKTTSESVNEMPIVEDATTLNEAPLDDAAIAKSYRSQADSMFKEAQRLRKEAESLDPRPKQKAPTKKAAAKKTTSKAKASD